MKVLAPLLHSQKAHLELELLTVGSIATIT